MPVKIASPLFFKHKVILKQAAFHFHGNIDKTRRERMAESHGKEARQMTREGQPKNLSSALARYCLDFQ